MFHYHFQTYFGEMIDKIIRFVITTFPELVFAKFRYQRYYQTCIWRIPKIKGKKFALKVHMQKIK